MAYSSGRPSTKAEKAPELLDRQAVVADESRHRVGVDGIVPGIVRMRVPSDMTMCLP
jgi:hypothetical protein